MQFYNFQISACPPADCGWKNDDRRQMKNDEGGFPCRWRGEGVEGKALYCIGDLDGIGFGECWGFRCFGFWVPWGIVVDLVCGWLIWDGVFVVDMVLEVLLW